MFFIFNDDDSVIVINQVGGTVEMGWWWLDDCPANLGPDGLVLLPLLDRQPTPFSLLHTVMSLSSL